MGHANSFKDLIVYQKAYKLAMEIFEISKDFPKEEKYSLTDQMRRSSRSVTSYDEVRKMLISMINNSDKWCL